MAELEAALRGGDRKLQYAHLQGHDGPGPAIIFTWPQQRQGREASMVEALRLEVTQIELISHQAHRDMTGQIRMAIDRRKLARTPAFIRGPVAIPDAQGELRVVIKEK